MGIMKELKISAFVNDKNFEKLEEIRRVMIQRDPESFKDFGVEKILHLALLRNMGYVLEEELKAQKCMLEYDRTHKETKK